jgi:crotonobetainyl-CoA:carnitine CoA-transferase CaiB-like acyl-CoA transferase
MLSGVRVLDFSGEPGWLAGRILADLGADVVKVEPPGGDRIGRRAPYLRQTEDLDSSLPWQVFQAGKRGIAFDGTVPAARWARSQLFAWADVVIETFAPPSRTAWGLDAGATHLEHPRLVQCSITPFGRSGPYAAFRAGDLVVAAMGGGTEPADSDRPPVRCTMPDSVLQAGPEAALGIVMALQAQSANGRGRLVDVSLQECTAQAAAMRRNAAARRESSELGALRDLWPARDGWVLFRVREAASGAGGLRALVDWLAACDEAPAWLLAIDWSDPRVLRLDCATLARVEQTLAGFFAARTREALFAGALEHGVPVAPCNDAETVARQPQLRARGLFTTLELPASDATIEIPGAFARSSEFPIGVRRRAPRIGEHQLEVFAEAGIGQAECEKLAAEGVI